MKKKEKIFQKSSGVYFRSNFNDWGLSQEFSTREDGSLVLQDVMMRQGVNEFKIADANWSAGCNFGLDSDDTVKLYHNYVMTPNSGANIRLVAKSDYPVDVFVKHTPDGEVLRIHSSKPRGKKRARK